MTASSYVPTAAEILKSLNNIYTPVEENIDNSDQAYSDDDAADQQEEKQIVRTDESEEETIEESKEFVDRKRELQDTNLNNSDD